MQISYLIVDNMYEKLPDLLEDKFWDEVEVVVPYCSQAEQFHKKPFHGSVVDMQYVLLVPFAIIVIIIVIVVIKNF